MPKYVVIQARRTQVVEAKDAKEALRKAIMKGLTPWDTHSGFKAVVIAENVWVHELDDGEEFKVSGKVDIQVEDVADPNKATLDASAEEYPVNATPDPKPKARRKKA